MSDPGAFLLFVLLALYVAAHFGYQDEYDQEEEDRLEEEAEK